MAASYISVPRDLTKVKSKVMFNLTKRQLICFGMAALIGVPSFFLLYRKFLKSSEIVYNRLEIKNDITKERRGLRHDVVYEVFCFGLG